MGRSQQARISHSRNMLGLPNVYKQQPVLTRKFRFIAPNGTPGSGFVTRASVLSFMFAVSSSTTSSPNNTGVNAVSLIGAARIRRIELFSSMPASGTVQSELRIRGGFSGANRAIVSTGSSAGIVSAAYSPEPTESVGQWFNWDDANDALFSVQNVEEGAILDVVLEFVMADQGQGQYGLWSLASTQQASVYLGVLNSWEPNGTTTGAPVMDPVGSTTVASTGSYTVAGSV
jgi:hypothetical protein